MQDTASAHKKTRQSTQVDWRAMSCRGLAPVNPLGLRAQVLRSPLVQSVNSITDHLLLHAVSPNRHVPFDAVELRSPPLLGGHITQGTMPRSLRLLFLDSNFWLVAKSGLPLLLISIGKKMSTQQLFFPLRFSRGLGLRRLQVAAFHPNLQGR